MFTNGTRQELSRSAPVECIFDVANRIVVSDLVILGGKDPE